MNMQADVSIQAVVALFLMSVGAAAASAAGVELREGVLVDPAAGRIYLMSPQSAVEALSLADGKTLWRTTEAAKPLVLGKDVLVSQAEPTAAESTLRLVVLDPKQGKRVSAGSADLPGVEVRIDDGLASRFHTRAMTVGTDSFISWEYRALPLRGMPPAVDEEAPGSARAAAALPRETQGTLKLDLRSGTVEPAAVSEVPPVARAARPTVLSAAPGGAPDPMQRLSVDGRHLLKSRQVGDDRVWEKYEWSIVDAKSGATVGRMKSHLSQASFVVVDSRMIYETGPFERRTESGMIAEPARVRAVDLKTGKEIWARDVRDTAYRGPFPP